MPRVALAILSTFAAVWLLLAKLYDAPIGWAVPLGGLAVSALLLVLGLRFAPPPAPVSRAEARRIGRIVGWASAGEGLGIGLANLILSSIGLGDRIMAGIALAVAVHFIPLWRAVPMRSALVLALIFAALSLAGFILPSAPVAALVVGGGGALTLWSVVLRAIVASPRKSSLNSLNHTR